jgi:hypothetical protein
MKKSKTLSKEINNNDDLLIKEQAKKKIKIQVIGT